MADSPRSPLKGVANSGLNPEGKIEIESKRDGQPSKMISCESHNLEEIPKYIPTRKGVG